MDEPLGPLGPKEKWIAALRSGSFKQYRRAWARNIRGGEECCCLGVAGNVCGLGYAEYDDMRAALGMSHDVMDRLIDMNDKEDQSFDEIADWVETHDLSTGELLQAEGGSTP